MITIENNVEAQAILLIGVLFARREKLNAIILRHIIKADIAAKDHDKPLIPRKRRDKPAEREYIQPEHVPGRWKYYYDKVKPDKTAETKELILAEAARRGASSRPDCRKCKKKWVCPAYQVVGSWGTGISCI